MKSEIIANLSFLLSSAKERGIVQGVKTFSAYIEKLDDTKDERAVYDSLYRELSGMQRFADFDNKEWQAIQAIFHAIESRC